MKELNAKIKRSISWLVCMTVLSFNLSAQLPINIEVEVIGPFPLQYQYWVSEGANYIIPVTNYSGVSHNYFLRASIQGVGPNNSDVFLEVREDFIPDMELLIGPYETAILTGDDIADSYGPVELSDFNISPAVDQDINASLPEGEYIICFEVLYHPEGDFTNNYFLGPSTCSESFTATHGDLELITPFNGDVLNLDNAPHYFSWILNSSFLLEQDNLFRLKIFQLPNGLDESLEEAIRGGAFPAFYVSEASEDMFFIYDTDIGLPEFVDGMQYAALVEMVSEDNLFLENGRKSNINQFTYYDEYGDGSDGDGNNDGDEDDAYVECMNRCSPELPVDQEYHANPETLSEFAMGNFTVSNLDITTITNNKLYGTGEVSFDFLNNALITVNFSNVEVNAEGEAFGGLVQGMAKPGRESFLGNLVSLLDANSPVPDNEIQTLHEIVNGFEVIQSVINGEPQGLPFGLDKSIGGQEVILTVTDFYLTPTDIDMDVVNIFGLSGLSANIYVAIGGSNICVSPDGFGQEFSFSLLNDNVFQLDGGLELSFNGGTYDPNISFDGANFDLPCFINIDCDGFNSMGLSGAIKLPQSMLKKEDSEGVIIPDQKVTAKFFSSYEVSSDDDIEDGDNQSNFLAQLSMDPFQINGLQGWSFELQEGSLDLSQLENADGFEFPENYEFVDGSPELWQGLYLKELSIKTPPDYSQGGQRGEGSVSNLLIDPLLSASMEVHPLLNIDQGNFKGWAMSIDTLGLEILQNNFEEGYVNGKFGAPVFDEDEFLQYNALIDQKTSEEENEDYYVFNALVQPNQNIDIPFAIADANICGSSYLAMQISPVEEDRQLELFIKGGLNMDTENFGGQLLGNASLNLIDYQIKYNSVEGFVLQQELDDGTGTYVGWTGENESDCSNVPDVMLGDVFDRLIDKYRDDGEQLDRTVPEDDNDEEITDSDFEEGNEMNGLPIRLKNSSFQTVSGNPKLTLGVEMELSENQYSEAGMTIIGNRIESGQKYHFGVEDVQFYYTNNTVSLDKPVEGSGLVSDQPVLCEWSVNLQNEDEADELRYTLTVVKISLDDEDDVVLATFEEADSLFYQLEDIEGMSHSIALSAPANPFVEGNRYAVRVQAEDPQGNIELTNEGFSEVVSFIFGQTEEDVENTNPQSECAQRCSPSLPDNTIEWSPNDNINQFTMGNFLVTDITGQDLQGNQINGFGVIQLDFLNNVKVNVRFNNVILNTDNQALAGTIEGIDESGEPELLSDVANFLTGSMSDGPPAIQTLGAALQAGRMVYDIAAGGSIGLPFGINTNIGGNDVIIAFTDFNLTPTSSDVDFVNIMNFPSLGENFSFGLGATDICLAPDGFQGEMKLSLPTDIDIPIDGEIAFKIKGGLTSLNETNSDEEPSYLEIDCNGFKSLNIQGEAIFPQNMLVKEDDQGNLNLAEQVKAYFGFKVERQAAEDAYGQSDGEANTDFMASLTMDRFQINGLEGWSFDVTDAYLDLSESENATNMNFPQDFDFDDIAGSEELWKGFYLKQMMISPPANMDYEGQRTSINVNDLLIDPQLSVSVQIADNILPYERGNIKGWGMSIDEFELNILQNNFVNGSMSGQFGSPLMGEDDFLEYQAILSRESEEITDDSYFMFNAIVRPPDEGYSIEIPVAGAPSVNICSSSYLGVQISPQEDETHMEVFLKGNMGVDISQFLGDGEGSFNLAAAQFQFKYNTVKGFVLEEDVGDGSGTTFGLGLAVSDGCTESFSPDFQALMDDFGSGGDQTERTVAFGGDDEDESEEEGDEDITNEENVMNGFPIRLSGFQLGLNNGSPELGFTIDLALSSGGQGLVAGASLSLLTERSENERNKIGFRLSGVDFGCARLACDFDFMLLVACLCHENDNGINGYFGQVFANINNAVNIDLKGGFGTMGTKEEGAYGTEDYYGLWYVDAKVSMPNGIVMGPVTLNGIGGGIYWNLEPPPMPGQDEFLDDASGGEPALNAVAECMTDMIERYELEVPSSVKAELSQGGPTPSFGKRAIKLNASLSIIKPELVIIDPLVEVEWTDGEGIDAITVGGYIYILQDSYNGRGAPPGNPPSSENPSGGEALSTSSRNPSEGIGSRLWMSSFNTLHIHREQNTDGETTRTLVAYEGVGLVYLNIIPNMLFGTQTPEDPYRFINKEILIGSVDHPLMSTRGLATAGDGETYWHAYFGNPYGPPGPGAVSFDLMGAVTGSSSEPNTNAGAKIEATAYFMTGHGIPAELPPVPDEILNIIGQSAGADGDNGGNFEGEEIDTEATREGNTTSGLAFGGSVNLAVGFNKIIYADLNVNIGMDLLMINSNGMTCAANGQIYSPPGMAGFYGMGQAYAGLEGALGVRGKILGKQIDIQFLELGAAMMIQVGGPNPFWVDGRAGVYYRVLGGMIEGNAYVEVTAGDRCYPYDSGLFTLDAIDRVFPGPDQVGANAVSAHVKPSVTFKVKVAEKTKPWLSQMQIPAIGPTGNTNLVTLAPVIEEFTVIPDPGSNNPLLCPGDWEINDTRRKVTYLPDGIMAGTDEETQRRRWQLYIKVKAKQKNGSSWEYVPGFTDDSTVVFSTNPLDPYIEHVTHTNPIRGQNYFMSDEWNRDAVTEVEYIGEAPAPGGGKGGDDRDGKGGNKEDDRGSKNDEDKKERGQEGREGEEEKAEKELEKYADQSEEIEKQNEQSSSGAERETITTRIYQDHGVIRLYANEMSNRFYSTDSENNPCFYEVVFKKPFDDEEVYRHRLTNSQIEMNNQTLRFPIPDLDSDETYVMQLVRVKEGLDWMAGLLQARLIEISGSTIAQDVQNQYNVSNNYMISYQQEAIDPYLDVNQGETLLHMIAFATSEYRTLEDKLEDVRANYGSANYWSGYDYNQLEILDLDEPFEEIELIGYNHKVKIQGQPADWFFTEPRVKIIDPLDGVYFEDYVKPVVDPYLVQMRDRIDEQDVGLRMGEIDLGDIDIDFGPPETEGMNFNNFGGGFGGFGGPNADLSILEVNNNDDLYLLNFYEESYPLINVSRYMNGHSNIYAESSLHLDDIVASDSYLVSPISQEGIRQFTLNGSTFTILRGPNMGGLTFDSDQSVRIRYDTREIVEEEIEVMAEYGEEFVQEIIQPTGNFYYQSWSESQVNNAITPFVNVFNDLINSEVYKGGLDEIDLSPDDGYYMVEWNTGNTVTFSIDPFRSSEILAKYSLKDVTGQNNTPIFGSRKRFTLD